MSDNDTTVVTDETQEGASGTEAASNAASSDDDGSGSTTGDDGSKATGQDDPSQEEKAAEGEPDPLTGSDNSTAAPGSPSYEALRIKLNDQGIEKNQFKTRAEEFETKHREANEALKTAAQELTAYKEWYSKYYPALNELWKDPEVRKRIEASAQAKTVSENDVQRLLEEKMSEYTTQREFEGSVDKWLGSHPDVKGQMAKDLYQYLEKHDLTPTPEILDMAYTFLNKDRLTEVGAKKKELQADRLRKASVGGGSGKGTAAPAEDPMDELFAKPLSHYYPA